jgi:superfamily II DNA or RNA helicase
MLTHRGYVVNKSELTIENLKRIKKDLTVAPQTQGQQFNQVSEPFPVYRETEKHLRLPRHYANSLLGNFKINKIPPGVPIHVPFEGQLKSETNQIEAVDCAMKTLNKTGGGVLSLPTGFGKTTVALNILSRLGVKTMIVVHKEFLVTQWVERINQFLPTATVGKIQQNKVDIIGKDIVICMLQSLAMKVYAPGTFESFGMMIIDETHHISSKVFSKSLSKICTKYTLGLSATPIRKDGLTKVIYWFIGDLFYSVDRKTKDIEVNIVPFKSDEYSDPPVNSQGNINVPQMITQVTKIDSRNEMLTKLIKDCFNNGRNIIVLSDRRSHCELMCDKMNSVGVPSGLYMGGMKQSELKESETKNVIFATFSLAQEGLDIAKLDTCILATPKTDVVQACGRIMRETVGKKNDPVIYDIVDYYGCFISQSKKRCSWYKKSGFHIIGSKPKEKSINIGCFLEE